MNFIDKPDIIISCGRKSVFLSIFLKKKYKKIINIHIQNPKVNFKYFNFIVPPLHDNINGKNVIESNGALHRFNKKILTQINDKNNITVNVWERGAGLTKACGTAACATAVASSIKKLTENDTNIKFKEGILNVKIDVDLNIFMTGPVSDIKNIKIDI